MESGWTLGYARVSADGQDLTAQTDALLALGVPTERVFTDKGMTGTKRDRPGLKSALAACRPETPSSLRSSIGSHDPSVTRQTSRKSSHAAA